jgi:hypothetical protein
MDAVQGPKRAGQSLTAEVRGTRLYGVEIEVSGTEILADCSCPYDWGGYCKHIGAVLLSWIDSPQSFSGQEPGVLGERGEFPFEVDAVELAPPHLPEHTPKWTEISFADRQALWQEDLERWLNKVKMADLRLMVKNRGWRLKGARKADLAQAIAGKLADEEDVQRAIEGLDDEHQLALRALFFASGGSRVSADYVERVAARFGALQAYKRVSTYARHLSEMGLALPADAGQGHYIDIDFVPASMARHFPPILAELGSEQPLASAGRENALDSAEGQAMGLRLADPCALVRSAHQLTRLLEQSPEALRPPLPRPRRARYYRELENWDYVPAELHKAVQSGSSGHLTLTVPPPGRYLPDDAMERLGQVVGGEARLEFLLRLLVHAGLFLPGSPMTIWTEVWTQFLRRDEMNQRALLARAFFGLPAWSVLWELVRAIDGLGLVRSPRFRYYTPEYLSASLLTFRHWVLQILASLPDGQWVTVEDLFRVVRVLWPAFDPRMWERQHLFYSTSQQRQIGPWALTWEGSPLTFEEPADWELVQGNFCRLLISGPLFWLGLVDLQLDEEAGPFRDRPDESLERLRWRSERLAAFRLHGLADVYWERVESPPPPPHAAHKLAPRDLEGSVTTSDLTISVQPSSVSSEAHNLLDQIARLESVELDRFVYRLDPQAAYQAFENGASLPEILSNWERYLQIQIPGPFSTLLSEWWAAYGRVRIYEDLTVIEFGDDYALAEMTAVTSLRDHLLAEVSPRLVIVRSESASRLMAELENAGYTPQKTDQV